MQKGSVGFRGLEQYEFDLIQMKSARSPLPILATALLVTTARQFDY